MYALKITKSDLPLITLLNGGLRPEVLKTTHYLIVRVGGFNEVVSEKEFKEKFKTYANGPTLYKLKK